MPVTLCFFLSGAAALILQVLWTRMLGHVFGATTLAVSTTLTAFMGGLALGSHLGGRRAPRLRRPLLAFAALESAVGLYGLLVPSLLERMPAVQRLMGLELSAGVLGYAVLRFVVVSLILLLPTTAMGATLPILAQGVVRESQHLASRTGQLYAANTFGAVLGAFLAGFVLIPGLGITTTVYLAAAIDLFVALLVLGLWRAGGGESLLLRDQGEETPDEILARLEPVERVGINPRTQRAALLVFALSGAAAMALEVLGTRIVGVIIGASTYSFTLILVTFLVGLAGGAYVMSKRVERVADPVRLLAWVQVAVGILAFLGAWLADALPAWVHATARERDVTTGGVYFTNLAVAAAVTLPCTLALGGVMPLVVRVLGEEGSQPGPVVGRAYALNTVGAILGSFLAGFVVVPFIGVERGVALASATSLTLGAALARARRERPLPLYLASAAGLLLIALLPGWNVQAWTAGLFRLHLARNVYAEGWKPSGKVVFHKDGVATTVTVEAENDGVGVSLKVNGKVDASDIGDMPTQVLSGLLPVLMHGAPKKVLVIGYGSGVTPGAVLRAPVERVDLAEIEAAVYEASNRHFAHVNHEPAKDPRFRAIIDDGRNFLLTREEQYDVIISEPSNPWMSGAASLFTADFFRVARARLAEGGVFLQWLQLYELSPENIHALIRTFHSVFPHVVIFTPDPLSNDTLVLGAARPLTLERASIERALADPALAAELKRAKVEGSADFFGLFLLGERELPGFVGAGPLNTDDNALIEFGAPRDLIEYSLKDARLPFLEGIQGRRMELAPAHLKGFDLEDGATLLAIGRRLLAQGQLADAEIFLGKAKQAGADTRTADLILEHLNEPDSQPVVIADEHTLGDARYARVVLAMNQNRDWEAIRLFEAEKDLEEVSLAHRLLYAYLCYRRDRDLDAEYLMQDVLEDEAFLEANPVALYYGGRILSFRGKYREAVGYLERFVATSSTATVTAP